MSFFSIHEKLAIPVHEAFSTSGFFYFAWTIPYGILTLIVAVIFLPWLMRLPTVTRNGFVLSAVIYITGVIIIESLSGWYLEGLREQDENVGINLFYELIRTVEESFEMIGILIFIYFASKFAITTAGIKQIDLKL